MIEKQNTKYLFAYDAMSEDTDDRILSSKSDHQASEEAVSDNIVAIDYSRNVDWHLSPSSDGDYATAAISRSNSSEVEVEKQQELSLTTTTTMTTTISTKTTTEDERKCGVCGNRATGVYYGATR